MNHRWNARHAADGGLAEHVEAPGHDEAHGQRHDQRLHPAHGHAHAIDEPDRHPDQQTGHDRPRHAIRSLAGHDVGGRRRHVGHRQIDPTRDDDQGLARGEDAERRGELEDVRHPARVDRTWTDDLDQPRERDEQPDQDQDRMLLHKPNRGHRPHAHARLNTAPRPPIMTTITISTPWIIWP